MEVDRHWLRLGRSEAERRGFMDFGGQDRLGFRSASLPLNGEPGIGETSGSAPGRMRTRGQRLQKGRRRRCTEHVANRVANKVVDQGRLPKTHLGLCRVHVTSSSSARHLQKQQDDRKRGRGNNVAICFGHGVNDQPIPHQPRLTKK